MIKICFIFVFIINLQFYISSVINNIVLTNGNYLIINQNGIYTYDKDSLLIINSYDFNNSNELEDRYIEKVSYFELLDNNSIFALIKNNLYIFSIEGIYKNYYKLSENLEIYYSINLFKSNSIECYYFVE